MVLGGLGQVWPLGFAQIPVVVATADRGNPALVSRYVCGRCLLPPKEHPERAFIAMLLEVGRRLHSATGFKAPLFCGNDHDLALTYRFRDQLADTYLLFDLDPLMGLSLLDKCGFQALAQQNGLPVPRVYDWAGENSVLKAERPIIVKPRSKDFWHESPVLQRLFGSGKARVFHSGAELAAQPGLATARDKVIIQDYIAGNDDHIYSFHCLAHQGELLEWFLGRKIRTFPKLTGESAFIELTREDGIFQSGADITKRLRLTGPFKMDFKRDVATGQFYLLEINARFNLWHYLGAVNGVNIPQAAYEYIVFGQHRKPSVYATTYRWNNFMLDYHAYRELRELGETTFWRWLRSLFETRRVQNTLLWKDPAPFILWAWLYLSQRANKWLSTAF